MNTRSPRREQDDFSSDDTAFTRRRTSDYPHTRDLRHGGLEGGQPPYQCTTLGEDADHAPAKEVRSIYGEVIGI